MTTIKMTMGFGLEKMQIPKIGEIALKGEGHNSNSKNNGLPPKVNLESKSTPKGEMKLWDEYTAKELSELKKNNRAIYISLYLLKYGFLPQHI